MKDSYVFVRSVDNLLYIFAHTTWNPNELNNRTKVEQHYLWILKSNQSIIYE